MIFCEHIHTDEKKFKKLKILKKNFFNQAIISTFVT